MNIGELAHAAPVVTLTMFAGHGTMAVGRLCR